MDDDGVSPVIGVVILIAITVVLAGMVLLLTQQSADAPDSRSIGVAERSGGELLIVGVFGGDLTWEEVTVLGCDPHPYTGSISGGEVLTGCSGTVTLAADGQVRALVEV